MLKEFLLLLKGGASLDLNAVKPKPFRWMLDVIWLNLVELSKLEIFNQLLDKVAENEKEWKYWCDTEAPEEEDIPCGYQASHPALSQCLAMAFQCLSGMLWPTSYDVLILPQCISFSFLQVGLDVFRKLLLIRGWCPDRTLSQVRQKFAFVGRGKCQNCVLRRRPPGSKVSHVAKRKEKRGSRDAHPFFWFFSMMATLLSLQSFRGTYSLWRRKQKILHKKNRKKEKDTYSNPFF